MSERCSWVAVRDMSLGEVLVDLELGVTGEQSDGPIPGLTALETLDDWVVVLGTGDAWSDIDEAQARTLSYGGWTLFFRSGDGAATELHEYRDGAKTWSLVAPNGAGLETAGALPEAIAELIEKARESGDTGALAAMPVRVGVRLAGFSLGSEVHADDDEPFRELEPR